jgi:hypothetical protein
MRFVVSTIVFSLLLNLGFVGKVFANTEVKISNNDSVKSNVSVKTSTGENTICVNGKCTTTSNENQGKSTVCVNGKCYTSEDGDINVKSIDGNTTVNIENSENNASNSSITPVEKKASMEAKPLLKSLGEERIERKHFSFGEFIRKLPKVIFELLF